MAANVPSSMRAIALAKYVKPTEYEVATLPTPQISKPDEVLIKVHAASINPVDVKIAGGMTKAMQKDTFPFKLGFDVSGTIVATGSEVKSLQVGDEVWSRIPSEYKGTAAEYVLSREYATAKKPSSLTFTQAAALPLAGLTALQAMKRADAQLGGLKGKTVFIPAGLSGTGSFAVQLANNVFQAGQVITTLSTGKLARGKELFGSDVRIIDYTKEDVVTAIGKGTVDYFFDCTGQTLKSLPVMKHGGVIISIATVPPGDAIAKHLAPGIPFIIKTFLNFADWFFRWWAGRAGVRYEYIFMEPSAEDLNDFSEWVGEGKVTPVVGRTAKLSDVEGVRKGCQEVYDGKGGVGKFVIEVV
jgi:NADPH:quinone reductase-like Zn-dependent oxidoreductase